jgi:hypothetical protein
MKFSLLIISSATTLQFRAAIAGWEEVESMLEKMESVARGLRDELEKAYSARCDVATLTECAKSNYHDCASMFPNPQCGLTFDDKNPHSLCQCGRECAKLF